MKILGWMHRKFRQNTTDHTQKDFSICFTGQASSDDLQYYPNGSYGSSNSKPFSRAQRDNYLRNSFTTLEAARVGDQEDFDEEQPNALTELFHGLLAIGTLGTEPLTNDPAATPTFSISVDHIAEKATQVVTEDELKLINDELEKVLGADQPRDDASSGRNSHVSTGRNSHVSAGRNSHVSAGRISHCSAITLGGIKAAESGELGCGNEAVVCPLQSYLFGSAVEAAPPARKEHRTSLGELFQKTKQVEEKSEKRSAKEAVKRMLKRRMVKGTAANAGAMDSAETKLHKILHMFNRKVHPENAISGHQSHKATKIDMKNNNNNNNNIESLRPSAEDIIIYPQQCISKQTHLPQLTETTGGGDAAGNELWDKTDADYLVLEL